MDNDCCLLHGNGNRPLLRAQVLLRAATKSLFNLPLPTIEMSYNLSVNVEGGTRHRNGHYRVVDVNLLQERYYWMLKFAWRIVTLDRSSIICKKIRKGRFRATRTDLHDLQSDYVSLDIAEWELALRYLNTEWKMSRLGSALIIPLSLALLQIDSVIDDALARTASVAGFIFSVAGLGLGLNFVLFAPQFNKRKCRAEWNKASQNSDSLEAAEFWSFLAFPMSLLIWSAILCVTAILLLTWNTQDGGWLSESHATAGTIDIISATSLMVLAAILAAFVYRCKQISRRLL